MNYATNIALVNKSTNIVENVIWGLIYQLEEFEEWGLLPVPIDDLAAQIGDYYDGTDFYHEGAKVLTNAEIFAAELDARDNELADLIEQIYLEDLEMIENV